MTDALVAMPKYEAYKETGIEWLGEIPADWDIIRFKYIASTEKGKLPKKIDSIQIENKPVYLSMNYLRGGEAEQFVYDKKITLVEDGEILLLWDGSNSGEFLKSRRGVISSTVAHVKTTGINENFAWHAYQVVERRLRSYTIGMGIPHVDGGILSNTLIAIPPIKEQIAIAKFLKQKNTKIDQAITIKERQIALLKERKQILIQNAVIYGLDPNVPMKDSGVKWIGKMPAHWEVRRSKFLFTSRKERAWKEDVQLSATQAYGVIPQDEYEEKTGKRVVKIQFHLDKRKHVEKDDFVISMRSFQGGLERAWAIGCIRSSYVVLKPLQNIDSSFYGYLLKLPSYIKALQQTASFIRDGQDLNYGNFSQVDLFIPPIEEQSKISNYIESFIKSSSDSILLLEQQIERLKEYKTIIINSAVTGKIKVA